MTCVVGCMNGVGQAATKHSTSLLFRRALTTNGCLIFLERCLATRLLASLFLKAYHSVGSTIIFGFFGFDVSNAIQ